MLQYINNIILDWEWCPDYRSFVGVKIMGNNKTRAELRIEQFKQKYAGMSREERQDFSREIAKNQNKLINERIQNDEEFEFLTKTPRERRMSNKAWVSAMGASAVAGVLGAGALYGMATQDWGSATHVAMAGMIPGLACGALITNMYEKKPISNLVTDIKLYLTKKKAIQLDDALSRESDKVYAIAEVTYDEMGHYKSKEEMGE